MECERCGTTIDKKAVSHPTLFGTVVCELCHKKQHDRSKGGVRDAVEGAITKGADGRSIRQ